MVSDARSSGRQLQSVSGAALNTSALADAPGILQPVVCIRLGDGLLFDVSPSNYPVYLKDSLINTNPQFDYGAFRQLAEAAAGSGGVSAFIFAFTTAGLYDFASSANSNWRMLVAVMAPGSACPTDAAIVPMTPSALIRLGARRSDSLLVNIDWRIVAGLLGGLAFIMAVVLVGGVAFQRGAWTGPLPGVPAYRKAAADMELGELRDKGSIVQTVVKVDGSERQRPEDAAAAAAAAAPGAGAGGGGGEDADAHNLAAALSADATLAVPVALAAAAAAGAYTGGLGAGLTDGDRRGAGGSSLALAAAGFFGSLLGGVGGGAGAIALDLDRWDDDDLDLREIIERLEAHAATMKRGFSVQSSETRTLMTAVRAEAEAIKRLLARSAFEQTVLSGAAEDEVKRMGNVSRAVSEELAARAAYDRRLTGMENDIMAALFSLLATLSPGPDAVAATLVTQLKAVAAGEEAALAATIRDEVLAAQTALDALATAVSEEHARRATGLPMWKAAAEIGALDRGSESLAALEALQDDEAATDAHVRRLMEVVEPFVAGGPPAWGPACGQPPQRWRTGRRPATSRRQQWRLPRARAARVDRTCRWTTRPWVWWCTPTPVPPAALVVRVVAVRMVTMTTWTSLMSVWRAHGRSWPAVTTTTSRWRRRHCRPPPWRP